MPSDPLSREFPPGYPPVILEIPSCVIIIETPGLEGKFVFYKGQSVSQSVAHL